ncbi:MAG: hypothetical protein A2622_00590 [Bdellovibrionales bacterium RIFCSPHIGHO2_01_FULL_40_29]|nr:MAG: hypothetical protein A2622_00590 [Bdellovibrionales bacterium RIFCSPHIGHO2_01_FULL_40_29]OFZ32619.1 MAG: hypothetical protein A3D17_05190 [Bdellovibrionales bacterium RIFCSPHIGHO2_02_FULL_40_15]
MKFTLTVVLLISFSISVMAQESTIRVRTFKDLEQFPIIQNAQVKNVSGWAWSAEGQNLRFQNKKISAKNYIIKKQNEKYDLISVVDFDAYVAGVVSKEMPLSWPLEALKAQAVIARSYALAKISERKNKIFHLDSNQMDQVFEVTDSDKAKLAVFLTDQVVLKDRRARVLKAYYHADCGGQTIPASKVWTGALDTGTATDPWCQQRKSNEWSFEIPKSKFYSQLKVSTPLQIGEKFQDRISTWSTLDQIFSVQKMRQLFGFSQIRNAPLLYFETDDVVVLTGKGFGHGAGLCQWGAQAQARIGRSYAQILSHYYPEAQQMRNTLKLSKSFLSDLVFN